MAAIPYEIVRMLLPQEIHPLPEDRQTKLRSLVAEVCHITTEEIQIPKNKKDGLWVCLDVPADSTSELIERYNQNQDTLQPLLNEFVVGQINQLTVDYAPILFTELNSDYISLIRLIYPGAERVELEQILKQDEHGGLTMLARFLHGHGKPFVRQIVKIGPASKTHQAWRQEIGKDLPLITPRLDNDVTWRGLNGLNYSYVGGGMFGSTQTLAELYRDLELSPQTVINVIDRTLGDELGQYWYGRSRPYVCSFAEDYSLDLVEHLRIRVRPNSADGVWLPRQTANNLMGYNSLFGNTILQTYHQLQADELVQIRGLIITSLEPGELTLQHSIAPGIVVRVETQEPVEFAIGDQVLVRGEIVYNRHQQMDEIAEQIFADFQEMSIDITRYILTFDNWDDSYPNPLFFYAQVLNQTLQGRRSTVYGNMHAEDVLVDQSCRGWLFDLEPIQERHNIYDFVKLETSLRYLLQHQAEDQFSLAEYIDFEENLVAVTLSQPAAPPENPHLQRAYLIIDALRQLASRFMSQPANFQGEYFPALFLLNLAALRHHNTLGNDAVRQAFITATIIGRYISHKGDAGSYSFENRLLREPV